ncbi:MAG: hypothetical protein QG597_2360 [Actinomycetota bacterium]|nr:hypothetical protein [Actinomycetota bacterium]
MADVNVAQAAHEQAEVFFTNRRLSRGERADRGARMRLEVPLSSHAQVPQMSQRRDPVEILRGQEVTREAALVPLRYERMSASPFAFLRGAAAVMASDLSMVPRTTLRTQLCGDAHLSNFGMFASVDRRLVFDLNDFDETLPGPFEWDVKRLAASVAVAGAALEISRKDAHRAARAAVGAYRETMIRLAQLSTLEVWFARLDVDSLIDEAGKSELAKATRQARKKSRTRTSDTTAGKLTEAGPNGRQFRTEEPVLVRVPEERREEVIARLTALYTEYLGTLPPDRTALLMRYSFVDVAHKVVGVGSVGTRALVLLLESGDGEPLLLQIKQAGESVLAPYLGASRFDQGGQRVVLGQQSMQATGDPFLGWARGQDRDYFVRQLKDMKGSIEPDLLSAKSLRQYARLCGAVLARAHARTGDASTIAGYLGEEDTFERAVADFAMAYTAITVADHDALVTSLAAAAG